MAFFILFNPKYSEKDIPTGILKHGLKKRASRQMTITSAG
jgi:hypothetical protein